MLNLLKTIVPVLVSLADSAALVASGREEFTLQTKFTPLGTILSSTETERIHDLVKRNQGTEVCYLVQGYFSVSKGSWTYRIIGRTRVLEIYRRLVLAGVNPEAIHISSLGKLTEQVEFQNQPLGSIVKTSSYPSRSISCSAQKLTPMQQRENSFTTKKDEFHLDYNLLDADPWSVSLDEFRDQILLRKNEGPQKLSITTYSDSTGSHYLNIVLDHLRALVLFRVATRDGYKANNIDLKWKGKVTGKEIDSPKLISENQRRALILFEHSLSSSTVQDEPEKDPVTKLKPLTTKTDTQQALEPSEPSRWLLGVRGGLSSPPSSIRNDVKWAIIYGLSLRAKIPAWNSALGLETLITSQTHARTKELNVAGHVNIKSLHLGVEYGFAEWLAGNLTIHGGLIFHRWSGEATYQPNGETNQDTGKDVGIYTGIGSRIELANQFYIEPQMEIKYARSSLEAWMIDFVVEIERRF